MVSSRTRRKVVKSPTPDEDEDMLSESGSENVEVEDNLEEEEDEDQEEEGEEEDEDELGVDNEGALVDEEDEESGDSEEEDDELLSQEEDEEDEEEGGSASYQKETKRTSTNRRKRQGMYTTAVMSSDEDMSETEVVPNRPLTKRQRAKLNEGASEDYLELPMDSGKKKHLTAEEQALRRSEVARRRKNQSLQRAEKDKADTINRLLKKQASKSKKGANDADGDVTDSAIGENGRLQPRIPEIPTKLRYVSNKNGSLLAIPTTMNLNDVIVASKAVELKKAVLCAVKGCGLPKKYLTSNSKKPVCSLDHYRQVERVKH